MMHFPALRYLRGPSPDKRDYGTRLPTGIGPILEIS
jgi:hypothetical protein